MTIDYNGEQAAPPPASAVIAKFLRHSFSVAEVLKRALRGWLFGLVGLVAGFAFGIYSIWITPPVYSVSISLLPTDSNGEISIGDSGGGALGALAGLLGMGGSAVPKFTRFVAAFYSTSVAKIMDERYNMICLTYKSDCDPQTGKWRTHTGFDAWVQGTIANIAHLPDIDRPKTASDLANYTESSVTISSDRTTHILTLTMEARDPNFASFYLRSLVQSANDYIKIEDLSSVRPFVSYLNAKLATTLNLAQHDALASLLVEQERRLMLSAVDVPYAATIQDGPNVSSANSALRMLAVDTLLGMVVGLAAGMAISLWRSRKRTRSEAWQR